MKAKIEDIRDTFEYGYTEYKPSRDEADAVWELFHNRHYTSQQLATLKDRGQPAETFNIIKLFARMLTGYYSTVVNTAVVAPLNPRHIDTAVILNDVINYTFKKNKLDGVEGDRIKLGGLISGILVSYIDVVDTGKRDDYNRPIYRIKLNHVPDSEIVLDPSSKEDDYSDGRFLHRFKWLTEETIIKKFGKAAWKKMDEYYNFTGKGEADFTYNYSERFVGRYRIHNNYLVVHTVMEDDNGERWSIFWHNDIIIKKTKITYDRVKWNYRVQKLNSSDKTEYYGIFREVIESQHAINQAVLKIQLLANTQKVILQEGAVKKLEDFEKAYNRINAMVEVKKLAGIQIEKFNVDIQQQYIIIDKALERIKLVLGINDSFLGMAFASDSGRKVKLQQGATVMSLRYITGRMENFYELLANDVGKLAQQYYYANQILNIVDENTGNRWIELNKPIMEWSGKLDSNGQPQMQPVLLPETNPNDPDKFMEDDDGNIIYAPVTDSHYDFSYNDYDITIDSAAYNDEDEKAQLLLETFVSGNTGANMMQVNPAGFFKIAALSVKGTGTKYTPNIVEELMKTAQMLEQNPEQNSAVAQANAGIKQAAQQPMSGALKLPTNTQGEM